MFGKVLTGESTSFLGTQASFWGSSLLQFTWETSNLISQVIIFSLKVSKLTLSISVAATAISLKKPVYAQLPSNKFLRLSTQIFPWYMIWWWLKKKTTTDFSYFFSLTNIPQMMIWSSMFANCFWLIVLTYARIFHFTNLFRW